MSFASGVGLSSGINYNDLITQLHNLNARPITLIQQKEQALQTKASSLGNINKALTAFNDANTALKSQSAFVSYTASSTDATSIGTSISGTAAPGQYSVSVLQLAQAERDASQGVAAVDSSISDLGGTFSFSVGNGAATTLTLAPGTTLQQLRDSINNNTTSGVRASIVNDGSGATPFRLVLSAKDSGATNTIKLLNNDTSLNFTTPVIGAASATSGNAYNGSVTSSGTYTGTTARNVLTQITTAGAVGVAKYKVSLDGGQTWSADDAFTTSAAATDISGGQGIDVAFTPSGTPADFALGDSFSFNVNVPQLQKAQDARINIDGVQITRSSNTFDDAIEGLSLTAQKVTSNQIVSVNSQTSDVQAKVKTFVSSYNALVDAVAKETAYDTSSSSASPLFGDSGVRDIVTQIRSRLNTFVGGTSSFKSLSDVGLSFDNGGHLSLDSTKLATALSQNAGDVSKLFVESGSSDSSAVKFTSSTTDTKPGAYAIAITQAAQQASVEGTQALAGSLAADERLTISYGTSDAIQVQLTAGQSLDAVITQINSAFGNNNLALLASSDGGKLKITSTAYGSSESIGVFSNIDASTPGQLGIGTTQLSSTGVDVAGTINGVAALGTGQTLKAGAGDANGLSLLITSKTPTSATINFSQGVGVSIDRFIASETDSTTGFFKSRTDSYSAQVADYEDQISKLNDRLAKQDATLKAQFTALESKLATLQSQGNFLLSQLNSINGSNSSSSSSSSK